MTQKTELESKTVLLHGKTGVTTRKESSTMANYKDEYDDYDSNEDMGSVSNSTVEYQFEGVGKSNLIV